MDTDLYQSFADKWTEALMLYQQTGIDRFVWFARGSFHVSTDDELAIDESDHKVLDVDKYTLEDAKKLPGAESFLRGAFHAEALRVAPYWVEILGPLNAWTEPKTKPPRLPDIIGRAHYENFALAYAKATVEALRSCIPHAVDYDYYKQTFKAWPMPPWYSPTDVPLVVWNSDQGYPEGLDVDPRSPGFAAAEIERIAYEHALNDLAKSEAESIMRMWWCGVGGRDPNYPDEVKNS